ncbi:N-acetyl sugar amidotransferase [Flaviaesturariibacter amylovorans]|uniref:N-acetyl sugar amidotransferase n=1 Tax=Flaviaesturariibacter amylovorans TaxID=1084520 RepID=A0ABP8GBM0_9BACT
MKICSRCIYDERVARISFDEQGVCNYCKMSDGLKEQYKTGTPEGEAALMAYIRKIKAEGKGKKYDCVIGLSGGTDSSYMLAKAVEWGLRPLAVHFDNTWNSAIATENIRKVTKALGVDLSTLVVDNKEMDDITRSFFLANVPELDCPTDIALAETLYRAASKAGVKYILEGHSFIAEGVSPMGTNYFDGKYISDIHRRFGKRPMKTFPNMNFASFMKWVLVKRVKKIRPLWYIDYSKETAKAFLAEKFGWQYYGGHHLENRISAFTYSVYKPVKFGVDDRNWTLAAAARNGLMPREEALAIYRKPIEPNPELVAYFQKRTGFSPEEYDRIMTGEKKKYTAYKTYKKRFERLRPLFYMLAKAQLVPMSFYIKYTSKTEGA